MARKSPKHAKHAKARRKHKQTRRTDPHFGERAWDVLRAAWARLPATVRVPGMDHDVAFVHALAFVAVLGVSIGAGYVGANALFGPSSETAAPKARLTIQQGRLPAQRSGSAVVTAGDEANGAGYAYEEKVAEEVYVAPTPEERAGEQAALPAPGGSLNKGVDGLWRQNALEYTVQGDGPMVAIVIDDMGVDRGRSKRMWETVPGPLTLSFMTYADDLDAQTRAARGAGHELMLHMPFEPSSDAVDPGPNVLRTDMDGRKIDELANWGMDRFDGFVGVNNHMGSRFTEDRAGMRAVLQAVQRRGLLFLDSRTTPKSVVRPVAREMGFEVLERNVFLDNDNDVDKVLHQLQQVERLARSHGHAIAIGHPRDATIEVLRTWIPEARARGLEIVPISTLYRRQVDGPNTPPDVAEVGAGAG